MHFYSLLPLSLAASVVALPGKPAMHGTQKRAEDICPLPFDEGTQESATDTWDKSGAGDFLRDFLNKNGVEKWVDELFKATVGNQGGSTYDCTNFPAEGSCTSPGHYLCEQYDPPEMFFVHLSIANCYAGFIRLHEAMQDSISINLASGIKDIVKLYGPPPEEDDSWIISLLSAGFVGGSLLTATFANQLTSIVSVTGMVSSGMDSAEPAETGLDLEHDLESSLGQFYQTFSDNLEETVNAVFGGDFSGLDGFDENPVNWIVDQFAGGKMIDHTMTDPAVDGWIHDSVQMIRQAFVIRSMKNQEWFVWLDWSRDETECEELDGHTIFMFNLCMSIAKEIEGGMAGAYPQPLYNDLYDAFVDDYGFDYQQAIFESVACNGGKPDLSAPPVLEDGNSEYPDCFINFDVKVRNDYGQPPPEGVDYVLTLIMTFAMSQIGQ